MLPETSYLDMSCVMGDVKTKRLLWGSLHRQSWLHDNDKDIDLLHEKEIRIEEHAVGKMRQSGVLMGNIIALLFFHFCFENEMELRRGNSREKLFSRFYKTTNMTLVDECGMMPLHPRKPFDRLFLKSIAHSAPQQPIEYINQILESFYSNFK